MIKESVVPLNVMNGVSPRNLSAGFCYDIPRAEELWDVLDMCWREATQRPSIHELRMLLKLFCS